MKDAGSVAEHTETLPQLGHSSTCAYPSQGLA